MEFALFCRVGKRGIQLPTGFLSAERLTNTLHLLRLFVVFDTMEQFY